MSAEATHPVLQLIRHRVSVERFDPSRSLSEDEIRGLVDDATQAPSSFNLQHWRFVAVRRPDDRERLAEIAYGQRQVADAAVTFVVLADPEAPRYAEASLQPAVDSGALPARKAAAWCEMARTFYADPAAAHDEAMRSGALAAMTLMLAAEARGLGAGALSGFDGDRLRRALDIPARYVPVMLLAVGWPLDTEERRKTRLPVDDVLAFDRAGGFLGD